MIRLLRLSNIELRSRWDSVTSSYVERPKTGQHSIMEMFTSLLDKLSNDRAQLIRSNLLFPTGPDFQSIIDAHADAKPVLRFASYGQDSEYRMITAGSPLPFGSIHAKEEQLRQILDDLVYSDRRNADGHPYVAELFLTLE